MNPIQQECRTRGITRLCHFTQSRNLAHIFGDCGGLLSTQTLQNNDMPHNPTDSSRYDGRDDLICCSIEYPNTYYFANVRNHDHLFKDWAVLIIHPKHMVRSETQFCPCNAARECGRHLQSGFAGFSSLFQQTSPGITWNRATTHLAAAPTDIQAEVLIAERIPLDDICGIAVKSDEQAQRELCRLRLQGINLDKPIYVAPDFYSRRSLSGLIQRGQRAAETLYTDGEIQ